MKHYIDKNGNVYGYIPSGIDVREMTDAEFEAFKNPIPTPEEIAAQRIVEIKARLVEIDAESVRPLRAKINGTETAFDVQKLAALDAEAQALREEMAGLVAIVEPKEPAEA